MKVGVVGAGLMGAEIALVFALGGHAYGERFRRPALLKQRVAAGLGGGKGRRGWMTGNL